MWRDNKEKAHLLINFVSLLTYDVSSTRKIIITVIILHIGFLLSYLTMFCVYFNVCR